MKRIRLAAVLGTLLALLSGGCSGPAKIYLKGVKPLNLNERDESTPVDVRVYFLKDNRKFQQAPFEDLWVRDREVLGEDLVTEPRVFTVFPGEENDPPQEVPLGVLDDDVRFIGILALFGGEGKEGEERHVVYPVDVVNRSTFELTGRQVVKK